jgi:hypothetical protein
MAMTEGWQLLVSRIQNTYIRSHTATLERNNFENLLEVGRAQGAIGELRKVLSFVEKCQDKIKE